MMKKPKVGQKHPPNRGLGYLTVLFLVAAALIIGASHGSLKQYVDDRVSTAQPLTSQSPIPTISDSSLPSTETAIEFVGSQSIESLINNHTGVSILTVTVGDSIRIEYLLQIEESQKAERQHNQNMLDMICAIRQVSPTRRSITFAGVGRFIDKADMRVLRTRISTKLSTLAFNRVDCLSKNSRNIDWSTIADHHQTYPTPNGLALDA